MNFIKILRKTRFLKTFILPLIPFLVLHFSIFSEERSSEHVILLHGLARSEKSMSRLGKALSAQGYKVWNIGYPSTEKKIETLVLETIPKAIDSCRNNGADKIHFVTHSMGGIMVRYYLKNSTVPELGRVVMLSPPNKGSEVVDKLRSNYFFKKVNGPAGLQLGTDKNSIPNSLGPVHFDLGIITGDKTINYILSLMIPGKDDGKVSIESAKVAGMNGFLVVHATHPFIMKNNEAIEQTIHYLKFGKFKITPE